jgi:hypothetical protein
MYKKTAILYLPCDSKTAIKIIKHQDRLNIPVIILSTYSSANKLQ